MNIFKTIGTIMLVAFAIKFGWTIMIATFKIALTTIADVAMMYLIAS